MVYSVLKFLTKFTLIGYFKTYKIDGKENIPKKGPFIFVANHPSAFMDPLAVATAIKEPVYFIAAAEYIGKGIKGWFFKTFLHMIPVYRRKTLPNDTHKNKDMFATCYTHLGKGNSLLIFPEGVSITERKLKEIKTGTARIALGAERLHNFKLNLAIVPIGLNYSSPHEWRSDLYVKIGTPIYLDDFSTISDENEIENVKKLTAQLQTELEKLVVHTASEDEEVMLEKLDQIYSNDLKEEFSIALDELDEEFSIHKDFAAAISYFKESKPSIYKTTENKIDAYLGKLNAYNLTDQDIGQFKKRLSIRRTFSFVLGAPLFIIGYVLNVIPYKLVVFFHSRLKLDETFNGSMALALGFILFLSWYSGATVALWSFSNFGWFCLLLPLLMYVSGLYTLIYIAAAKNSIQRIKLRSFYSKNTSKVNDLIAQRREIIAILTACKEDYLAQIDSSKGLI